MFQYLSSFSQVLVLKCSLYWWSMVNCVVSFYIGCMQPFIPLLFSCNSAGIFCFWERIWPLTGKQLKTHLSAWRMTVVLLPTEPLYPMHMPPQSNGFTQEYASKKNPGSSKEKQLRGQIWACSISLDNAHHSNIKLKSHQVALNFMKVPCGSEAAMKHSEARPQR